jgi:hypothetical protein
MSHFILKTTYHYGIGDVPDAHKCAQMGTFLGSCEYSCADGNINNFGPNVHFSKSQDNSFSFRKYVF